MKELIFKVLQGTLVITITTFFLLPYFRASSAVFNSQNKSQAESYISPLATDGSSLTVNNTTYESWSNQAVVYTPDNLGISLPWLDLHNGTEEINWLNTKYKPKLIENDLTTIQSMGITKVRAFCQMESIFNYTNGEFVLNEEYAKNLDDFLNRAEKHGIAVICVLGDGNYDGSPKDLSGNFHWDLIQKPEGLQVYKDAYVAYIDRFSSHRNILMWDIFNEPYGSLTWSFSAKALKITPDQVHSYLLQSYKVVKPLAGNAFVGFSDIEEEQQSIYQLFSDPNKRKKLVDDCTDIYAMHIYRALASEVADFRSLNGKPKWVLELGNYNYSDPEAIEHPIPADHELYNPEENYIAVTQISRKLLNSGFTLIMPWGFASNNGMVKHNPDGSHTLLKLAQFMKDQLLLYKSSLEVSPSSVSKL